MTAVAVTAGIGLGGLVGIVLVVLLIALILGAR